MKQGNQGKGEERGRREKNDRKRTTYEGERAIHEGVRIGGQVEKR